MLRLCWCCCSKKAHVLTVSPSPGWYITRPTAERDSLICPSQERSPCWMRDWEGCLGDAQSKHKSGINIKQDIIKTESSRWFMPSWAFAGAKCEVRSYVHSSALSAWNWKRQPPTVVCRLLGSDTEAGSSHMTSAVTCAAYGGRGASGRPRLAVRAHPLEHVQLFARSMQREWCVSARSD